MVRSGPPGRQPLRCTVTADQRVTSAREYLDGARKRKVTQLPPSLLIRECAELRRHLGQLLDVIGEQAGALQEARAALLSAYETPAVMLTAAQVTTVLDGLAIAAEYRRVPGQPHLPGVR